MQRTPDYKPEDKPGYQPQNAPDRIAENAESGAAFNTDISGEPIPETPGVGQEPQEQNNAPRNSTIPLSQDVDPIHQFEEPEDFIKQAPLMGGPMDSATSDADAGLDSDLDEPTRDSAGAFEEDDEAFALETADLDEDLDGPLVQEIPMGNLDVESADEDPEQQSTLMSPSLDAPEVPGEVDIEALGDNAIEDLLPPDARLDPIED